MALVLALSAFHSSAGHAQQLQEPPAAPEREPTTSDPGTPEKKPKPEKDRLDPYQGKGFLVAAAPDGTSSLTISSRLQLALANYYYFPETGTARLFPSIESVRLIFSGNVLTPDVFYTLQIGFGEAERYFVATPLLDAWVDFRQLPEANLRIGTLDHHALVHSSAANQLTTDSLAHYELDLLRDVGVRVHANKPFGVDWLKYWFEVAGGKGLDYVDDRPIGLLYYGRIEVSPLGAFDSNRPGDLDRRKKPALALGVSAAYNHNAIYPLSNWKPPGMLPFQRPFNYVHGGANLHFKWRGFSLLGVALYRRATELSHHVLDAEGQDTLEYSRNAWGWFSVAGMMLTRHLEIAGRVGAVYQIDRPAGLVATAPYQAAGRVQLAVQDFRDLREAVGGLNYYFAGHSFKLQSDYARIFVRNFEAGVHEVRLLLTVQL